MARNKSKNTSPIIQNINIRPAVRSTQDIGKWRRALQAAEAINPQRTLLYDLYADLLLDGHLSSVMNKRILGVTKTELRYFDKNGDEVEVMTELINKKQFRNFRKQLMLQKFWGITVCELKTDINGNFRFYNVPRKHIRPDLKKIVWEQTGTEGISYVDPPASNFIVEVGEKNDLGLLLKAAQYVIYKRGDFGDWAKFAELFGMPFREARYDGYNDAVRIQLEKAMEAYGAAPYAVLPKEAEFNLHQTTGTQGSGNLYDTLRKACNEELSVLILGQTETTNSSDSSGYAQSITHANVEDDINEDDREDELAIMNEDVQPILANLGFPVVDGGYFDHVIPDEQLSKKEKAGVIVSLHKGVGLPIDDDSLYEEFGIKKPDNYEEQKTKSVEDDGRPEPAEGQKRKLSLADKARLKIDRFFH